MSLLQDKLKLLEAKHRQFKERVGRLPVYYGWAKLNKIQKREALTVIFLNDHPGPRIDKDGEDGVSRFITPVYKRWQTDEEMQDAEQANRMYSVYSIFMDDRKINGSLDVALRLNFQSDKNHVSVKEREKIRDLLRDKYLVEHPDYREPCRQLDLFDC
ncbi:MAG: hypothetical protein IJ064_05645 [Bacteroidaceae bacterium]|nr:hypothetical protein [Bacteroidaceae bacterium]